MLSSRFAGIPISSSIIDGSGVPQLPNRGEQTTRAVTGSGGRLHLGMVAGIKSERWPTSNRNPRPDCVGIRTQRNEPSRPSIASASLALALIAPARFKCNQVSVNKIRFWLAICLISAMLPDDSEASLQRLINRFSAALRSHVRERDEINLDSQIW